MTATSLSNGARPDHRQNRKPRVTLIAQSFPPETGAPANRIGAMAEALAVDCNLTVVTLAPSYPTPESYAHLAGVAIDADRPFAIKRPFVFAPHVGGFLVRGVREVAMTVGLGAVALPVGTDVVIVSTPSMFLGPVGLAVARMRRARFVWDVRDLTWRYAVEATEARSAGRLIADAVEGVVNRALQKTDLVVAATEGGREEFLKVGVSPDRVIVVPNGIAESWLRVLEQIPPRQEEAVFRLTYVGTVGYNQRLTVLVDVAKALPDVEVLVVGDGPERGALERKAQNGGLSNLRFTGFVRREELLHHYERSDLLFAQLDAKPALSNTALPSKLFEYMATSRPIVYAGEGIAAAFVREQQCGVVVPANSGSAVARAVRELRENRQQRLAMSAVGRPLVRSTYLREGLVRRLAHQVVTRCWSDGTRDRA